MELENKLDADSQQVTGDATPQSIDAQVEQIISNALGSKITPDAKAKLHSAGELVATLVGVLLPLAKDKIDETALLDGLSDVNQGFLLQEQGISKILSAKKQVS